MQFTWIESEGSKECKISIEFNDSTLNEVKINAEYY